MVAEEAADLVAARRHPPAADDHFDVAVIVAQIARVRPGAEIDPFAEVAMSEETFVVLVAESVDDAGFHFAANAALRAEGDAAANPRPHDLRLGADDAGALDATERGDHGALLDDDRAP